MNENTNCYYKSALKCLLPVELEPDINGFIVHLGSERYYFYDFCTPINNLTSSHLARNKYVTNIILGKAGIPVPDATYIDYSEYEQGELEKEITHLSFPLVAKPMIDGRFGEDVLCNIQNIEQLRSYLESNFTKSPFISIEKFYNHLNSYRVLVFKNSILGVILRNPAHVLGDGKHSIEELIELSNEARSKISDTLKPIIIDDECHIRLNELGLTPSSIPRKNERITLCYTCNSSRGGTYVSLENTMCQENKALFIKARKALNLKLVGFDVLCHDLNQPIATSGGVIIEANDSPSVRIHEQPITGRKVLVTRKIVKELIYRHPFSYLLGLFSNKKTRTYLRGLITILILTGLFLIFKDSGSVL